MLVLAAIAVRTFYAASGRPCRRRRRSTRSSPAVASPRRTSRQLQELTRRICNGRPNAFEVHQRLRPLAREIAGARLARQHGIDLDRRPERARALVGPRTWELVRPDREPPVVRYAAGWSEAEVTELVDELERI